MFDAICTFPLTSSIDPASLLHALTPQTLLLATDSSALHLYDLRSSCQISTPPSQTHHPHDEYISSLTPLPATDASTSGFSKQWISTGGTTVAVTDLRRGVLVKSEDQGEELLSSTILGRKLVVGGEKGGLRIWEVGVWDDNEETVVVGKGASADVLAAAPDGHTAAVGMDDGVVRFVGMGGRRAKVLEELRHDEVEGVLGLGFEVGGRMISGGGSIVKVWEESQGIQNGKEDGDDAEVEAVKNKRVHEIGNEDDDSDGNRGGTGEEDERPQKSKKRRKKKGKGQNGAQHIMAFKGMD
ncbi:WD repeat-containing protein 55, partial [Lecanoromycetidae sp. Uapishka_2]